MKQQLDEAWIIVARAKAGQYKFQKKQMTQPHGEIDFVGFFIFLLWFAFIVFIAFLPEIIKWSTDVSDR
jgi:hypothetical protein